MATWKEKGEVPDSDDEGDLLDNQNFDNFNEQNHGSQVAGLGGVGDHIEREEKQNTEGLGTQAKLVGEDSTVYELPTTTIAPEAMDSKLHGGGDPVSSPFLSQQPLFKDPRTIFDLDDTASESLPGVQASRRTPDIPAEDEISESYVRLTSPMSSLLSSPPSSQEVNMRPGAARDLEESENPPVPNISDTNPDEAFLQAAEGLSDRGRRLLRQRNAIQLHPYIVEQERYRRSLNARGMTPIRLARAPDAYSRESRNASVPELGPEEPETQDSQYMDIDWNSDPPSSGHAPTNETIGGDNDEFPDLNELFHHRQPRPRQSENIGRQEDHLSKPKRRKLIQLPSQPTEAMHCEVRSGNIFDVPASPPLTSSPLPIIPRNIRRPIPRAMSISSGGSQDEEPILQELGALPTPATSATKPGLDPISSNASSDSEDPFATEPSALSSSDESVEIRKITKKFRGVLPASHLRLDQNTGKRREPIPTYRSSLSASPVKQTVRRGVALPKFGRTSHDASSAKNRMSFLSEDSDGQSDVHEPGFFAEEDDHSQRDLLVQQRIGFAEEEDKIDAMLPPRKRNDRHFNARPRKKRRTGDTSLFPKGSRRNRHQVKITEHLTQSRASNTSNRSHSRSSNKVSRASHGTTIDQGGGLTPPRLGILDVISNVGEDQVDFPRFIKIAARTAKSRNGHGRQSPSKKFIRLASREDTADAQAVLREWRAGKIRPKPLVNSTKGPVPPGSPLHQIADNFQSRLRAPIAKAKTRHQNSNSGGRRVGGPRRLVISKGRQRSISDFVTSEAPLDQDTRPSIPRSKPGIIRNRHERRQPQAPQSRPAQLELSEIEYSYQHPTVSFGSRKKALDTLYRKARKRQVSQSNIPLSRFLAGEDNVRPTVETNSLAAIDMTPTKSTSIAERPPRRRKRAPQRLDVGASIYRQPSEPLVLQVLPPMHVHDVPSEDNRLQGLGKFGTSYTTHFDILPLRPGIFFHETTFLGGGHLAAVLNGPGPLAPGVSRPQEPYHLGDKAFQWGSWNENVSSEIGVCFDWVLDQLDLPCLHLGHEVSGAASFIVEYVQHHLAFTDPQDQRTFLLRMIGIFKEVLSRLAVMIDVEEEAQSRCRIEVLSLWTVLAMQLLRISRTQLEHPQLAVEIEVIVVEITRHCTGILLRKSLESIRKLYDELQYLSVRESGIREDQYAAHAWVVVIKILEAARIPRASFWDVTNTHLLDAKATSINDARLMEKTWYSIFSLLPLCEFDERGVVMSGQRQIASFDNWSLPQTMFKNVFRLYLSNSRQSPSFNDYCRALFSRCHYLIVEWGWWKCSGTIGVLFDFFASQSLGHLRNEEVYKSPHFLEELDTDPSLAIELEDRCFHTFLKIVALAIKHMREVGDGKSIRNLVARLLPNHDRQYPKEEALDTRDLASLRNHHDLLCTLYWAAPPGQRPSLTLVQDLVAADRSHNAACLINLRAWEQLARFVLTLSTTSEEFHPLAVWQNMFFGQILNQYLEEDSNTRRQAQWLAGQLISETRLRETIMKNKTSTMQLLRSCVHAMRSSITSATSSHAAMAAFNTRILKTVLNTEELRSGDLAEHLLADTVDTLSDYMHHIQKLHPNITAPPQSVQSPVEIDSQESLDMNVNVDRQMMIYPLYEVARTYFRDLVHHLLDGRTCSAREPRFIKTLIQAWAQMVSLVTEESLDLKEFVLGGSCAVFPRRRGHEATNKYWPLFLGDLLHYKTVEDLELAGLDVGLEWMLALTAPQSDPDHLTRLTLALYEKRHPLIKPFGNMEAILRLPSSETAWLTRYLIKGSIDSMRDITKEPQPRADENHGFIIRRNFSSILKQVMCSMQHGLESMTPGSILHGQYVKFCQGVAEDIRSRGSEILPLTDFFVKHSANYWPAEGDPKLFAAGIISYSLRLRDQPGRTSSGLFHYLYRGWRSDLVNGRLQNHVDYLTKGMKHWAFTEFTLTNFVPAALYVGFNSDVGWVLSSTYLPPLAIRISKILERNGPEASVTLGYLANILKVAVNGCIKYHSSWQGTIKGLHPLHRGIVAVTFQFWLALVPVVNEYVDRNPGDAVVISEVSTVFTALAQQLASSFGGSRESYWETSPLRVTEGPHVKNIVGVVMDDIGKNWNLDQTIDTAMQSTSGQLSISGFGPHDLKRTGISLQPLWGSGLEEVLDTGRPYLETGSHPHPGNQRHVLARTSDTLAYLFF